MVFAAVSNAGLEGEGVSNFSQRAFEVGGAVGKAELRDLVEYR